MAKLAVQGVDPWKVIEYFRVYLQLVTDLDARHVRMWWGEERPHLQGSDVFVWFRWRNDNTNKSLGPGRWGNRSDMFMEVHLVTRNFSDESQIDEERGKAYFYYYWKLIQSLAGCNLFDTFTPPPTAGDWTPPQPILGLSKAVTVEPMYFTEIPMPTKTQREEGVVESRLGVILPVVLALTVP